MIRCSRLHFADRVSASLHCTSRSSSSHNQKHAGCSGTAELSVRSILLIVPSAQSVPGSGKETGEHCSAHHAMAGVLHKDGSSCCLHPGLPPGAFPGVRKVKVSVLPWWSCNRAAPLLTSNKGADTLQSGLGITIPWLQETELS